MSQLYITGTSGFGGITALSFKNFYLYISENNPSSQLRNDGWFTVLKKSSFLLSSFLPSHPLFFEREYVALAVLEFILDQAGLKHPPADASQVLGIKVFATAAITTQLKSFFPSFLPSSYFEIFIYSRYMSIPSLCSDTPERA